MGDWGNTLAKECSHCRISKPAGDFYKKVGTKTGLSSWCRQCSYKKQKEYRSKDPNYSEKRRDYMRVWQSNNVEKQKIYSDRYYKKNKDNILKRTNYRNKLGVDNLSDKYIMDVYAANGIPRQLISDDMILIKRIMLQAKREAKTTGHKPLEK